VHLTLFHGLPVSHRSENGGREPTLVCRENSLLLVLGESVFPPSTTSEAAAGVELPAAGTRLVPLAMELRVEWFPCLPGAATG